MVSGSWTTHRTTPTPTTFPGQTADFAAKLRPERDADLYLINQTTGRYAVPDNGGRRRTPFIYRYPPATYVEVRQFSSLDCRPTNYTLNAVDNVTDSSTLAVTETSASTIQE